MPLAVTIADALNTYNYSIDILKKKCYSIFLKDEDDDYILYLEKGEVVFQAEDPLSLLSLAYLTENNLNIPEDRLDPYMNDYSSNSIKVILQKKLRVEIAENEQWYDWMAFGEGRRFFAR